MPSIPSIIFVVLLLLCLTYARPQTQTSHRSGAWAIGALKDWDSSGNYLIYSCSSQAAAVKSLLDITYLYLQTALLSTTPSDPPYKAFFRTADPAPVRAVLASITAGSNITTRSHGYKRPTVVCVNSHDPGIQNFWQFCQEDTAPVVMQPPDTAIVFLCPLFFERPQTPTEEDCGTVNRLNTGLLVHTYIAGSQYGFLMQALADMYIRELSQGQVKAGRDVREENDCLALPPERAVKNPSSYSFFASNVRAGCTEFPSRVPVQRDRELLATGTGNLTIECLNQGNSSCSA